jgi:hypothetical protein
MNSTNCILILLLRYEDERHIRRQQRQDTPIKRSIIQVIHKLVQSGIQEFSVYVRTPVDWLILYLLWSIKNNEPQLNITYRIIYHTPLSSKLNMNLGFDRYTKKIEHDAKSVFVHKGIWQHLNQRIYVISFLPDCYGLLAIND